MAGKLSIVATPIGNLEDVTLRALRTFREAEYVLCEDTRVTGKLMARHGIEAKLKRYDAHASERAHETILADLASGKHIALATDAGTPGISDPGVFLVARVRKELPEVTIETIPGPSAVTAAFSIAGIPGNAFTFLGFVPQKKGRATFFKRLAAYEVPVIFYESPHRIAKALESLAAELPTDFRVTVARELTKLHEEVIAGSPAEVRDYFTEHPDHVRGEFVIIVSRG